MPGLTLTPEMLEGAYEYLRVSPPFSRWGLPHADHVMFRVLGAKDRFGHFRGRHKKASGDDGFSEIAISAGLVRSTDLLLSTMAHEMIHLYQDETGTARGHHNPKFLKLAKRVCAIHGFDPGKLSKAASRRRDRSCRARRPPSRSHGARGCCAPGSRTVRCPPRRARN